MGIPWTNSEDFTLCDFAKKNVTWAVIAAKMGRPEEGCQRRYMRLRRKNPGLPTHRRCRNGFRNKKRTPEAAAPFWTKLRIRRAVLMRRSGSTYQEIANVIGCSASFVFKCLMKHKEEIYNATE